MSNKENRSFRQMNGKFGMWMVDNGVFWSRKVQFHFLICLWGVLSHHRSAFGTTLKNSKKYKIFITSLKSTVSAWKSGIFEAFFLKSKNIFHPEKFFVCRWLYSKKVASKFSSLNSKAHITQLHFCKTRPSQLQYSIAHST